MGCIAGFFVGIYRFIIRSLIFVGLLLWIIMLPVLLLVVVMMMAMAFDTPDSEYPILILQETASDYTTAFWLIVSILGSFLLGPFAVIRLLRDENMPQFMQGIARWFARRARFLIRLYAFTAGFSAIVAVGFGFLYPQFERFDPLAIIMGATFTVFIGYARTIDQVLEERKSHE